jgi:hypothetical protein
VQVFVAGCVIRRPPFSEAEYGGHGEALA